MSGAKGRQQGTGRAKMMTPRGFHLAPMKQYLFMLCGWGSIMGYPYREKLDAYLIPYTKINSKCIKGLNVKSKN